MTVEVVTKKKNGLTCGECGASVSAGATECPECGSESIKKSLVIVRKAVGDEDDDLETAVDESEEEEVDDEEEEEEEEDDDLDEDDEDDDDDDEEDEEEDEEDEDDDTPAVKKSLVGLEALNISTALAEDIVKVFSAKKPSRKAYDKVMVEVNNVMDAAADHWFAGSAVSKSKKSKHTSIIQSRVNGIINKEGTAVMARPEGMDFDALDDDTKAYITSLESKGTKKTTEKTDEKITKRADLPEDVRKSLEAADKIVEENETRKWDDIAKKYSHLNMTGATLRKLSEDSPEAFAELTKSLDGAQENLAQSEIFKSHGRPGAGATKDEARETAISKAMEADPNLTREQAEVSLMNGGSYRATA